MLDDPTSRANMPVEPTNQATTLTSDGSPDVTTPTSNGKMPDAFRTAFDLAAKSVRSLSKISLHEMWSRLTPENQQVFSIKQDVNAGVRVILQANADGRHPGPGAQPVVNKVS